MSDNVQRAQPDTVQPKTVGDLRAAMSGLPDEAQMFVSIDGHGWDYAVGDIWRSQQIPNGKSWPTDKRVVGLEIRLGLFPEPSEAGDE